jgi:1-aminocyclopropane-1-carboxylate deaminase/D-cysteine desulfhydrase-like pyridoxal-dependent ACC family enzyme
MYEFRTGNNYLSAFYSYCSQAKGLGYAINTSEELKFVKEIATTTGVVLDPVYR